MLTGVKKPWLVAAVEDVQSTVAAAYCLKDSEPKSLYSMYHIGIDRTLFLARKVDPNVTKESIQKVIQRCNRCQSIDPRLRMHEVGKIQVGEDWKRLAIDMTH